MTNGSVRNEKFEQVRLAEEAAAAERAEQARADAPPPGRARALLDRVRGRGEQPASVAPPSAPDPEPAAEPAPEAAPQIEKKDTRMAQAPAPAKEAPRSRPAVSLKDATDGVRSRLASVVWLIAVVCALFLAVGALLVALKANSGNALVDFVKSGAHQLDLGVFSPGNGLFKPQHDPHLVKGALVNWGLGAVAFLVVGRLLDRLIRP